jgi:hypothetical protein
MTIGAINKTTTIQIILLVVIKNQNINQVFILKQKVSGKTAQHLTSTMYHAITTIKETV